MASDYKFRMYNQLLTVRLVDVTPSSGDDQFRLDGSIKVPFQNRLSEAMRCKLGDPLAEPPRTIKRPTPHCMYK